jgi:hypothetical protein
VPQYFVYYVAFFAFVALYWLLMSRRRQSLLEGTSSMRAGEVVAQLGMALVKGDPSFHLFADATPSMGAAGVLLSGTPFPYEGAASEILAQGTLDGRATELHFYAKARAGVRIGGVIGREIEVERKCRLTIAPRTPVPDFELVLRESKAGAEAERVHPSLPVLRFGDTRLDGRYQLFSASPEVARRLGPALAVFDDQTYVHVVAEAGRLSMPFTLGAIHLLAGAPKPFLQKLDFVARALE